MDALFGLLVFALVCWLWIVSMRAREFACTVCKRECEQNSVQFLDSTVALARLRVARDNDGYPAFRRTYQFEFSIDGADRHTGSITVLGRRIEALYLAGMFAT